MSVKQQALLLSPSLFPDEHPMEKEVFNGIPCAHCHGNGQFWGTDEKRESVKKDCPVCKGTGMLKAVVTISWEPDVKRISTIKDNKKQ